MNYTLECILMLIKQNGFFNVLGNEFRPVGISWFHNYIAFKSVFVIEIHGSLNHFTWHSK